jgi:amino-acid N-acetyltransferase
MQQNTVSDSLKSLLDYAATALSKGVDRVHIIDDNLDGGLLQELFTREGAGMMVTNRFYEGLRVATIDDIGGILELIQPLEEAGILIKRSPKQIELEIDYFRVIEKDGMIIACIASIPDPENSMAEIACVAVHTDYRKLGFGEQLLEIVELEARKAGIEQLFILTTRTSHWFLEKGYNENSLDVLPDAKRRQYNRERQSLIMTKTLS